MKMMKLYIGFAVLIVFLFAAFLTGAKVPLDADGNIAGAEKEAGPDDYINSHWEDIGKEISSNQIDLNTLLKESNDDFSTVAEKYCRGSENNFTVSGTADVIDADTTSKSGYLTVKPENYSGQYEFRIQIGPIFKGTALRDSLTCIRFSDFDNQMQWSEISTTIMNKITSENLSKIDFNTIKGKKINFIGCFSLSKSKTVQITPFSMTVE